MKPALLGKFSSQILSAVMPQERRGGENYRGIG